MSDLGELLSIARRAAEVAGEVIMPVYRSDFAVETKADRTPVTIADRNAEEAVRRFLERECPGHGVIGEEFGETPGETPGDGRHRWVLDPIDGTKAFIHRVPLFGTLIALERDGVPVVGVIACHAAGETASAATGLGAFLNGEQVRVSEVAALGEATVNTTSYSRLAKEYPAGFERLVASGALLRTWGDCYGYLLVASGRAEAMLDPEMNLWDVAALYPIIQEAGGRITTFDGAPGPGASSIATNGRLHEAVLAAIHGE